MVGRAHVGVKVRLTVLDFLADGKDDANISSWKSEVDGRRIFGGPNLEGVDVALELASGAFVLLW